VKKNNHPVEGSDGLVHIARLPLSSATLNWLADLLRGHFKKIGSRWRALPAGKIAGIVLAVLRCDQRPGDLAGGNGIHRTTVTRWVREVVGLLAARAPRLDRALKKIARKGGGVVLLDGSVIRTRRRTGVENRKNHSGRNKCHGLLVIALLKCTPTSRACGGYSKRKRLRPHTHEPRTVGVPQPDGFAQVQEEVRRRHRRDVHQPVGRHPGQTVDVVDELVERRSGYPADVFHGFSVAVGVLHRIEYRAVRPVRCRTALP
jgi:hypothetical protein